MKKEYLVKTLALGVVVLLVGTGIVSGSNVKIDKSKMIMNNHLPESDASKTSIYEKITHDFISSPLDELCYPVLNGTLGDNGWYVSNVTVSFVYDPEKVATVYYILDGAESIMYTMPFEVCDDKEHYICWYYIDYYGNYSGAECKNFKMDQTPPDIELTWEAFKEKRFWYVKFTALCNDNTSGMNRVEWAISDVVQNISKGSGPIYTWTIKTSFLLPPIYTFKAIAFDKAGNSAFQSINGSDIKSCPFNQSNQLSLNIQNLLSNLLLRQMVKITKTMNR
jgi:hypothetical protein